MYQEGVLLPAVQVVGLAQEGALLRPERNTYLHICSQPVSPTGLSMRTCVARKPGRPDHLRCHAFLQA